MAFDGNKTKMFKRVVNLHDVPDEKFSVMVQKTLLGVGIAGVGVWGILHEWNHYFGVAVILVGGTVWSGQVVTNALMLLVAPFKALLRVWRGKDDGPTDG